MAPARNTRDDLPVRLFESQADWEAWLEQQTASAPGVWLRIARQGAPIRSVSYAEAVEVALCYGWIDGQKRSFDDTSWLQKFTPRRATSVWSKVKRAKAEELIRNGRMRPAGLRAVEQARQDGRWEAAYDSPAQATVPADFQAELERNPAAKAFFATLNQRNRYALLWRIQTARKAETRAKRIQQFIRMLEQQELLYP